MSLSPSLNTDASSQEIYIGRQPILDRQNRLVAYELLYRSGFDNYAFPLNQEVATSEVLVNSFLEIGFDQLVGNYLAFINVPRGLLLGQELFGLPRDKVVLEILEHIEADEESCLALAALRDAGFKLALDDFIVSESNQGLLKYADIVKVDVSIVSPLELQSQVSYLSTLPVKLLAEKVETPIEFQNCLDLGFEYFQGYYFFKPEVLKGSKLNANQAAVLQLLTRLYDPNVKIHQIEEIIKHDVSLSFKLLRICNSASFGHSKKIESISQAVIFLGLNQVRRWVAFIVFSGIENKPLEISNLSLLRAYMCWSLAKEIGLPDSEKAFTVGMFSALDALFDRPMQELLDDLSLTEDVVAALVNQSGVLGDLLQTAINYQQGQWEKCRIVVSAAKLRQHFIEAMVWADDICASLHA